MTKPARVEIDREVFDWLKEIAETNGGQSATQYVNDLLRGHAEKHLGKSLKGARDAKRLDDAGAAQ